MRYYLAPHHPPPSWQDFRANLKSPFFPFHLLQWSCQWISYFLGKWSFIEVLEYLQAFSVLIAVILFFAEAPERVKLRHYQAWQVVNSAQGKGGSGGRIEALQELAEDHQSLTGVDVTDAFLQGIRLPNTDLRRSTFNGADLKNASLPSANFEGSSLHFTNLRNADLSNATLTDCSLTNADLTNATLANANLQGVNLDNADLTNADLSNVTHWQQITTLHNATIANVRNAPEGFQQWSLSHGAVQPTPAPH